MSYLKAKDFKENYGREYGAVPQFEWIEDDSSFGEMEENRGWNQIKKKCKQDPLIPCGTKNTSINLILKPISNKKTTTNKKLSYNLIDWIESIYFNPNFFLFKKLFD